MQGGGGGGRSLSTQKKKKKKRKKLFWHIGGVLKLRKKGGQGVSTNCPSDCKKAGTKRFIFPRLNTQKDRKGAETPVGFLLAFLFIPLFFFSFFFHGSQQ
eukprot:TRINITY_DN6249_c2_g1_i2.p2 TRINITY_DN6249_c2_g1~~TRINITY_DN6249_c2_g1_i2.p2  ORF type:complete len:100 (-),score=3.87 TRINITY_DN6249_c2_g1_i2:314-613(-)